MIKLIINMGKNISTFFTNIFNEIVKKLQQIEKYSDTSN